MIKNCLISKSYSRNLFELKYNNLKYGSLNSLIKYRQIFQNRVWKIWVLHIDTYIQNVLHNIKLGSIALWFLVINKNINFQNNSNSYYYLFNYKCVKFLFLSFLLLLILLVSHIASRLETPPIFVSVDKYIHTCI